MLTTLIHHPFFVFAAAVAAIAGWILGWRPVERALADVARFPRSLWMYTGSYRRHHWRAMLIGGYALGGWPGMFVARAWYRAGQRAELLEEVRWRKTRARPDSTAARPGEPGPAAP